MEFKDREEIAAAFAGMHNLFGVLVKRLADEHAIDLVALIGDVDGLMALPGLHPLTRAVQNDGLEVLHGVLVRAPHEAAGAIQQHELPRVAPLRQVPEFDRGRDGQSDSGS
jgi:hypothetical protein